MEPFPIIGFLVFVLALASMLISRTRGPRFQSAGLVAIGMVLLFSSVAEQIVDPLAFDWVGIALGAALTALGSIFLRVKRSDG